MGGRCRGGGGGLGRASSPLKERRTRGADCRLEPRQTHKANRRSQAPDAVMATVMQVARRELNLDRKKKEEEEVEAAEEWTIITELPMRNKRDKKRREDRRDAASVSDLSDQKSGLQPSRPDAANTEPRPKLHTCSGKYDRPIIYLESYWSRSEVCVETA